MRGAGDIDEHSILAEGDNWRPVPRGGNGEAGQLGLVAVWIGRPDIEPGHLRARLGDGHAGPDAERLRGRASGGDEDLAALADGGDEG
jgi:hypothetical protein